jgi:hypothetical protein
MENITLKNENSFITYVNSLKISAEAKKDMIEHETAHFKKALNLGFNPRYVISWYLKNGRRYVLPRVAFEVTDNKLEREEKEKVLAILSAPKEVSSSDKVKLEHLIDEGVIF